MTKYFITGGAGFIGLNLVHHLSAGGEKILLFDDFSTGRKKFLRDLPKEVKVQEGSVMDLKELKKCMKNCEYVIHLAGQASVPKSVKDPVHTAELNILGTLNTLIAARDAKVKRLLYVGSACAYGESPSLPKLETMANNPLSPYGVSTIAAEHYCRVFFTTYGLPAVILRAFNVYGPLQDPSGVHAAVIPKFVTTLLEGKAPIISGDGKQSRDFVHVSDLVDAVKSACVAPKAEGEVFNIASGSRITVNGLVNMLNGLLGKEIQPKYEEAHPGDIRHSLADITRAQEMLGFRPRVSILDGLRTTLEWYRKGS
ncbi:MAG: NAD-dependent epimerase/dehydratase family protein [Planctomycetaceae bacterium]